MSSFKSFNKKLFTLISTDYSVIKKLNSKETLLQAVFSPLQVPCVLRKIRLVDYDLELLENENDIDKMVDHPNLISIITSFVDNDLLYTVFPMAEHFSADILCKPYGLDETIIAFVLFDVLNAINYLHRNDIIHRAIKGSHILVFGSWETSIRFVLTGLKYSIQVDDIKTFDYPKNASDLLKHMAPEILEQNILGYDFKSDIYSVGVVCCELANGIVPFDNLSTDELLFYKVIGDIPKLLDSTSEEMLIFKELLDQLELSLKRRYLVYLKKKYTSSFHQFTMECLHMEPLRRPTADVLMNDNFLKTKIESKMNRKNFQDSMKALLKQAPM